MGNTDITSRISSSINSGRKRHLELLGHGCPKGGSLYIGNGGEREYQYLYNGITVYRTRIVPSVPLYTPIKKDIYVSPNPIALLNYVKKNGLKSP